MDVLPMPQLLRSMAREGQCEPQYAQGVVQVIGSEEINKGTQIKLPGHTRLEFCRVGHTQAKQGPG